MCSMDMDLTGRNFNVGENLGSVRGVGFLREERGWASGWLWVGVSSEVTAGDPMHAASLPFCLLYTLMPFTDQIKAQMTNAQRLETSVLEHTVHPSPC